MIDILICAILVLLLVVWLIYLMINNYPTEDELDDYEIDDVDDDHRWRGWE